MRIRRVYLKGLNLNLPPKEQPNSGFKEGKIKIYVDEFICDQAHLIINTLQPSKLPVEFDISNLDMKDIGPGQPLQFDATLQNPKPVGDIHSKGLFGPWQADEPRSSPVKGKYSFTNADLSTINGIAGILSSTGEYSGTLDHIVVDGETDTPDFQVATSGHRVPLHTNFHAIVDGTSGDTYLQPVQAQILHSALLAKGSILRVNKPNGHRILLDVSLDHARIEDLLKLGVRTDPPVMTGAAKLKIKFDLWPGATQVSDRLRLAGIFRISGAHFTNKKVQSKVDALSMRGQGHPKEAQDNIPDNVLSEMNGAFKLSNGLLSFSKLHYQVPGTKVDLTGKYSLDGNQFDFHGKARMNAKLSHMVTGWKSILLKPVDPFFSKDGAGTEVPVKITGTKSEPHFGLDFGHKND
jgi:AsmA-like C-terminal region